MGPEELSGGIDYVLLAAGMSRIRYVERRIGALFPNAQVFDNAGVQPDEAIVAGLADTASYERLNLHRPGFDFVVEWEEGGQAAGDPLPGVHPVLRALANPERLLQPRLRAPVVATDLPAAQRLARVVGRWLLVLP